MNPQAAPPPPPAPDGWNDENQAILDCGISFYRKGDVTEDISVSEKNINEFFSSYFGWPHFDKK